MMVVLRRERSLSVRVGVPEDTKFLAHTRCELPIIFVKTSRDLTTDARLESADSARFGDKARNGQAVVWLRSRQPSQVPTSTMNAGLPSIPKRWRALLFD